jgi:hypothetical protein
LARIARRLKRQEPKIYVATEVGILTIVRVTEAYGRFSTKTDVTTLG